MSTSAPTFAWAPNWLTTAAAPAAGSELPRVDRAVIRTWPQARRDRWADLAELGEEQGHDKAEAEALAFLAVSNEIEADGPEPETYPGQHESFAGWSPTLEPIDARVVARRGKPKRQFLTVELPI